MHETPLVGVIKIIIKSIRQIMEVVGIKVASFLDVLNNIFLVAIASLLHSMGV
jgi:hypothetical protein